MKVISKKDAMVIRAAHPDHTVMKFDSAKYKWNGTQNEHIGKEVPYTAQGVVAIYAERRADKYGPYAQYMCVLA